LGLQDTYLLQQPSLVPQSNLPDLYQVQVVQELFDNLLIHQLSEAEVLLFALKLCNKVQAKAD